MDEFIVSDGSLKKYNGSAKSVIIPFGVVKIESRAFIDCTAEELIFSEGVELIDVYACVNMFNLKRVVFPSTLRKIGYRAFGSCKRLATEFIDIPDNTSVDPNAFQGCCKRTFKEVECIIHCETEQGIEEDKICVDLYDEDEISDVIQDQIDTYYRDNDLFYDLIQEAISRYDGGFDAAGTIGIDSIGKSMYDTARDYVHSYEIRVTVSAVHKEDFPGIIEIDIGAILEGLIEDRTLCEQWDCDVGCKVESLMSEFMDEAAWHTGFKTNNGLITLENANKSIAFDGITGLWSSNGDLAVPVIWFGYDVPTALWTIDENIDESSFSFWFVNDESESLYRVVPGSDNGCFDIWYFAECGRWFPVISEIMDECPISFDASDTAEMIKGKIDAYFCGTLEIEYRNDYIAAITSNDESIYEGREGEKNA